MTEEKKICRFCLAHKTTQSNPFISPCNCKGSLEFVHLKCLNRWRQMDVVRNSRTCFLCLTDYRLLAPFEFEQIPENKSISLYCLNYPGLLLLGYNYIYAIAIASNKSYTDYIFLRDLYVASHYVFHFSYIGLFWLEWEVRNKEFYWRQLKTLWTPFILGTHLLLFSFLQHDGFLVGPILSFYMGIYWKLHLHMLQAVNTHLVELEND